ncbi:MAG: hypothetical protein QT11_C0001G0362 [archaeon GW2011_AR20]|nr:MAG: hypothetical protein QT11_C0001G0362 [archaeon GW2011_AR20]AQS28038.1 hypothetical protein [uncultured archaeon]AQS28530.1 hypothetical protein [uncultured archaeon]AQS28640.1 hypothetical protein [uncultured archaeon]MBS3160370.1 hypothetical protein [Candidatus Woesearchaeota archaeon]
MRECIFGRFDLLSYYHYTSLVMKDCLEDTISTREIKNKQYPLGILRSAIELFNKTVKHINIEKYGTLIDGVEENVLEGDVHYLLAMKLIKGAEKLSWKTKEDTERLESRIIEFNEFSRTLDKPRELNKQSLEITKRLFLFFSRLEKISKGSSYNNRLGIYSEFSYS